MAIAFVGEGTATTPSGLTVPGGTFTVVVPSGASVGDLLLLFVNSGGGQPCVDATNKITGGANTTWTHHASFPIGGSGSFPGQDLWYRQVASGDPGATLTINVAGLTGQKFTAYAVVYSGVDTTTPIDSVKATYQATASTSMTTGSGSTTQSAFIVTCGNSRDSSVTTTFSALQDTSRSQDDCAGSSRVSSFLEDTNGAVASGSYTKTATNNQTLRYCISWVALVPASTSTNATVTPGVVSGTGTVPTPGISAGLTASAVLGTTTVPLPAIPAGPNEVIGTASIPVPAIIASSIKTAAVVSGTASVPVPAIPAGPNKVIGTASIATPVISAGAVATPAVISGVGTVSVPVVTAPSSATVTPAVISGTATIAQPGIRAGLTASVVSGFTVTTAAVAQAGSVKVSSVVSGAASITAPTVQTGSTVIQTVVLGAVSIPVPAISTGSTVANHAYWGMWTTTGASSRELLIGRKLAIQNRFFAWTDVFPGSVQTDDDVNGRKSLITWEPWATSTHDPISVNTLADIASGVFDSTIDARATAIAASGKPTFIRFGHEMNGSWYPWSGVFNSTNFISGDTSVFTTTQGTWTGAGNSTTFRSSGQGHQALGALTIQSAAAGTMVAAHCNAANILTQGMPVTPGQIITVSGWIKARATGRNTRIGASFFNSSGTAVGVALYGSVTADVTTGWTHVYGVITVPATAAFARVSVEVQSTAAAGELHDLDDVVIGDAASGPSNYIAAWQRVHDRFVAAGATNAIWVWCPNWNDVPSDSFNHWTNYYPGDSYVDWVAIDGYNNGWVTFSSLVSGVYASYASVKPIMIAETASVETGGDKAQWITDMVTSLKTTYPAIKAVVWFDAPGSTGEYVIDSSVPALNSYIAAGHDPWLGLGRPWIDAQATIPAPTVQTGSAATPSAVIGTASVPMPSITAAAGSTPTPAVVNGIGTVPAPVIAAGSVVAAAVVNGAAASITPSLQTGSTVVANAVAGTGTVPAPAVSASARATPGVVSGAASIPVPVISAGETATGVAVSGTTTIPIPAIPAGPTRVTGTASVPQPVISAGAVVTASAVLGTGTAPTPSIQVGGSATVAASVVNGVGSVPALGIIASSVITGSVVSGTGTVPAPVLSAGSVALPASVAGIGTVPAPGMRVGSTVVALCASVNASVPVPAVSAPLSANVAASVVTGLTAVSGGVVHIASAIMASSVAGTASIIAPGIRASSILSAAMVAGTGIVPLPNTYTIAPVTYGTSVMSEDAEPESHAAGSELEFMGDISTVVNQTRLTEGTGPTSHAGRDESEHGN